MGGRTFHKGRRACVESVGRGCGTDQKDGHLAQDKTGGSCKRRQGQGGAESRRPCWGLWGLSQEEFGNHWRVSGTGKHHQIYFKKNIRLDFPAVVTSSQRSSVSSWLASPVLESLVECHMLYSLCRVSFIVLLVMVLLFFFNPETPLATFMCQDRVAWWTGPSFEDRQTWALPHFTCVTWSSLSLSFLRGKTGYCEDLTQQ